MTEEANGCPFHDLPPGTVVRLQYGLYTIPRAAELACEDYHDALVIEPLLQHALDVALKANLGDLDNWAPEGLRSH